MLEKENRPCHCAAMPCTDAAAVPGHRRHRHRRFSRSIHRVLVSLHVIAVTLTLSGAASAFAGFCICGGISRIRRPSSPSRRYSRDVLIPIPSKRSRSAEAAVLATTSAAAAADLSTATDDASATTTMAVDPSNLPSIVNHILHHTRNLDDLYDKSSTIRCPFLRRRAADIIDGVAMILRFLVIRHKSLGIFDPLKTLLLDNDDDVAGTATTGTGPAGGSYSGSGAAEQLLRSTVKPPGWKAIGKHVKKNADGTVCKNRNLPLRTVADTIRRDWECGPDLSRGYYLTGRLNSTIYTDDCLFDGPDPDMPVRGLRKYLSAASHLFERETSFARMLDIDAEEGGGRMGRGVVMVRWRLGGTLMLPWRPSVKPWTGTTRYHLDEEGLIYLHEEEWDITVAEAFVCTVFPRLGELIWGAANKAGSTATL